MTDNPAVSGERRTALVRSAAAASITLAVTLVALKAWATWRTGSAAMLGSFADSFLDLFASITTLLGVWIAAFPADRDHRFGHGKAEALAAMVQVMLIAISAFAIFLRSIDQFMAGGRIRGADEGIAVSLVAIVLTLALLAWQRHVMRATGSVAIRTDHLHYQSDLLLNLSVIMALVLQSYVGLAQADPVFGILIALWLGVNGFRASREAVDQLMDKEWPEEKRRRFVELAAKHPELSNLHDLRTRTSGNRDFVQFHVYVDADMSVAEAHDIIERVEADLTSHFPDMDLLIHIDPEGMVDEPDNPLVEEDEFAKLEKPPE